MFCAFRAAIGVASQIVCKSSEVANAISAVAGEQSACTVASTHCTCDASIALTRLCADFDMAGEGHLSPPIPFFSRGSLLWLLLIDGGKGWFVGVKDRSLSR